MSSRPRLIAGIVGGAVAGVALFALALVLVAILGDALSAQMMATLVMLTLLGFLLDATWLCVAVDRLRKLDHGSEGGEGEGGGGRGGPGPPRPPHPRPPSEDPDWWPEFERDFRDYLQPRERAPAAD
jgi:hypothetical protein